jgi:PAS domain S-box-containing protein
MKILLAEDDKDLLLLLETSLRKRGYSVESAPDGKAALEKAQAAPPDLIVSDVMMPEMDGFMFCRKVKASPELSDIPVILYTATRTEAGEAELALKLGAVRMVTKTNGIEPLLAAIEEELKNAAAAKPRPAVQPGGGEDVTAEYVRVLSRKLHEKERELRRERDLEKMYLDIAGVMIVALDAGGRITMANKKSAAVLGYGENELTGKNWFETCLPDEMRAEVRGVFGKIMAGDVAPVKNYENPVLTKNGEKRLILFHNSMIRGADGEISGVLFSGLDITAQRQAEEALFQAQKLDSIGLLSAGVAHDLNNLLGPILAYADFLRKSTPQGSAQQEDINEISRAAGRAAELVRQLLAFSRRQKLELKVLDLNAVIKGLDGMLRRILGEQVRLVYSLDPAAGYVKADQGQMEQVLVNLALNAREAMPKGGALTISTGIKECHSGENRGMRSFAVTVADTGCGMEPDVLSRIFEPFFTTKGSGRGMGLGLSAVYGIVKQSGGEIHAASRPGEGAAFSICLPLCGEQVPAASGPALAPQSLGAVLVVEDDETMLRISKRILSGAGYKVLEAVNGKEALKVLEQNGASVSLVLTDMMMPELDGLGLAKEVLAKYPAIKILCMSGYEDKQEELLAELGAKAGYLPKPFAPDALLDKVAQVLSGV